MTRRLFGNDDYAQADDCTDDTTCGYDDDIFRSMDRRLIVAAAGSTKADMNTFAT